MQNQKRCNQPAYLELAQPPIASRFDEVTGAIRNISPNFDIVFT
jgi:hypothetical protein